MNRLTRPIALFLFFALSFYIVPKEFIHAFYGHEDTADHSGTLSANAPLTLSPKHLHCGLLSFETDLFTAQDSPPDVNVCETTFVFQTLPVHSEKNAPYPFVSLRGPPLG